MKKLVFSLLAALALVTLFNVSIVSAQEPLTMTIVSDTSTQWLSSSGWEYVTLADKHPTWYDISGASWIWPYSSIDTMEKMGPFEFRRTFSIPEGTTDISGTMQITADNEYTLYVNGQNIGGDNNWYTKDTYSVTLVPGENTISISAQNDLYNPQTGEYVGVDPIKNPAGLTYRLDITYTINNQPPVANAGPDQSVIVGPIITLDGSGSLDPEDGTSISYQWTIKSKPRGSKARLSDPTSIMPTFTADKTGDFIFQLIVIDKEGAQSQPDSVTITVTEKCDFSTKRNMEKCFGGIGIQCEGIPKLGLGFQQDQRYCYVYGWMSVGSIQHDQCCDATGNRGVMCAHPKTNECRTNWYQAMQDVACGRFWTFSWGPYYAGAKKGDDTSRVLKAPVGAHISPDYQYLCPSGACRPNSISWDFPVCGKYCVCQ